MSTKRLIIGSFAPLAVALLAGIKAPCEEPSRAPPAPFAPKRRLPLGPFPPWCRTPAARERWAAKRGER